MFVCDIITNGAIKCDDLEQLISHRINGTDSTWMYVPTMYILRCAAADALGIANKGKTCGNILWVKRYPLACRTEQP
jgi:hypothetical protein